MKWPEALVYIAVLLTLSTCMVTSRSERPTLSYDDIEDCKKGCQPNAMDRVEVDVCTCYIPLKF